MGWFFGARGGGGGGGTILAVPAFTPVADQSGMLGLADTPGQTVTRADLDGEIFTQVSSPPTNPSNWRGEADTRETVLLMGESIEAGMPLRIGSDGKGYKCIGTWPVAVPGSPYPSGGPGPVGLIENIVGVAAKPSLAGSSCVLEFISLTLDDWSLVCGSASLTPLEAYYPSQTTLGMISKYSQLLVTDYDGPAFTSQGYCVVGIGRAITNKTLKLELGVFGASYY
jgi:hypothetical protein